MVWCERVGRQIVSAGKLSYGIWRVARVLIKSKVLKLARLV